MNKGFWVLICFLIAFVLYLAAESDTQTTAYEAVKQNPLDNIEVQLRAAIEKACGVNARQAKFEEVEGIVVLKCDAK